MRQVSAVAETPAEPSLVDAIQPASVLHWFQYRELIRNIVLRDLRLKYRGSVLGFLWSLVNPLVIVAIYTLAFGFILRVRTEHYVLFLVTGLLPWVYFAGSASAATGAIIDSGSLVKSVYFPRAILPVSVVLFNLSQFAMTFAVVLPVVLLLYRIAPSAPMLAFPCLLLLQTIFTIGVALLLATATAFFRDVRHLLEIALQVMFWLTPIIYEYDLIPASLRPISFAVPMTPYVMGYRQSLFYQQWPDPAVWALSTGYAALAFFAGLLVFRRYEDRFTELL
jgi:ABC-type polysaccharide/polyol phosphate export permease